MLLRKLNSDNGGDEENAAFSSDNFQDNGCVNDMSADISSESPLIRSPLSPLENTHFESLAMTETIRRLTEEVSILKKKNTEYEIKCSKQNEEIGKLKNTLMLQMESMKREVAVYKEKMRIIEAEMGKSNKVLRQFLTPDQIASLGKMKMQEWSKETVTKCLKLRFMLGIDGYEKLCSTGYPAPSLRTLSRKVEHYEVNLGVIEDVRELLKFKASTFHVTDRSCTLCMDEMEIMSSDDYDKMKKKFNGFVSVGSAEDKKKLASHFFIILLRGTKSHWKQVIACAATSTSIKPEYIRELIFECIDVASDCGLKVIALTNDMGNNNIGFYTEMGIRVKEDGPIINFFVYKGNKILITPDPCHLLKNLWSAVRCQSLLIPSDICTEENLTFSTVSGEYIRMLWQAELRANKKIRSLYHLREEDLWPNIFQKMNVGSARRYFLPNTAAAIELAVKNEILPEQALTTACFIRIIAKWFELVTSRHIKKCPTRRNKKSKIAFLQKVQDIMRNVQIGKKKWKPLNTGFTLSTASTIEIIETLLAQDGTYYVLLYFTTQDAAENVFTQIRKRVGQTPTVTLCLQGIKIVTISQFIDCHQIKTRGANYMSDSDAYLLDFVKRKKENNAVKSSEINKSCSLLPAFHQKFPTYRFLTDSLKNLGFNLYDTNLIFYQAGSITHSLLKLHLCETCSYFLKSEIVDVEKYSQYFTSRNFGGLLKPNLFLLELVLNCEIVFKRYEEFIIRNHDNERLIEKIFTDIDLPIPHNCKYGCTSIKKKTVEYYFNTRSNAIVTFNINKKRKKEMYGTANPKKKKV